MRLPTFGTVYVGTYDPLNADADLKRIAGDFDWIAFPMSEELSHYQWQNVAALVRRAKELGLTTYLGTSGLLGLFGGEGLSTHADECLSSCRAKNAMQAWMLNAIGIHPDGILWNEPDPYKLVARKCRCLVSTFLNTWICKARNGLIAKHAVYFRTYEDLYNEATDLHFHNIDVLATNLYGTLDESLQRMPKFLALAAHHGAETLAFVKAFDVRDDEIDERVASLKMAPSFGVDHLGVWGYAGSRGMGALQSSPWLWPRVIEAIRVIKDRREDMW
jgi:hypothetical protein